jgi:hypothetical protein
MAKKTDDQPGSSYVVAQQFRDKNDFSKTYEVGEDANDFDEDRIADLLEKGLITVTPIPAA